MTKAASEEGSVTAEYAISIVAAVALAIILYLIIKLPWFVEQLAGPFRVALESLF